MEEIGVNRRGRADQDVGLVEPDLVADLDPDRGVERFVRHPLPDRSAARRPAVANHVFAQVDVAIDDELPDAVHLGELGGHRFLELLPDPRDREEDGRTAGAEVLGDGGQATSEPGLGADRDRREITDHPLGDVTQRKKRQESLAAVDLQQRHCALEGPHDVGVADHRALGRPGRAARIYERRQASRQHRVGTDFEEVGLAVQARGADRAQLREAEHERVVEAIVAVEHDNPVELRELVPHLEDPHREIVVFDEADVGLAMAENVRHLFG